ncbi:MAG: hypothetical protein LBT18_01720 [Endomicrobium sp.]|jgi:acetyl-CoA carboxylase biotin carboxyl carrier protein|nr:hypothetical protein [Endomicrobium sp.]
MDNSIRSKVKSLYEIMQDEKIQELKVNSKDCSICIKRKDPNENNHIVVQKKQTAVQKPVVSEDNQKELITLVETIKSPITGVFYKSPSPSSPSFINEGNIVEIGKTVCIIEAMKVMNEIKAIFKAKIVKILVDNGTSVNSGQDLFEIEKV